jgi:hypothetical protein
MSDEATVVHVKKFTDRQTIRWYDNGWARFDGSELMYHGWQDVEIARLGCIRQAADRVQRLASDLVDCLSEFGEPDDGAAHCGPELVQYLVDALNRYDEAVAELD